MGAQHGIWVIIVAHPRSLKKQSGKDELEEIDMYTISGSANWANLADFIFLSAASTSRTATIQGSTC